MKKTIARSTSANEGSEDGGSASDLISKRIADLGDWRGKTLARMRKLIKEADPEVVEEWKWRGTPVWEHDGIICTGESYKDKVKLTFAKGASLNDSKGLFNSSLDGNVRRAIDIAEGEDVDAVAFKALVRDAIALNGTAKAKRSTGTTSKQPAKKAATSTAKTTATRPKETAATPKKAATRPTRATAVKATNNGAKKRPA